MDLADQCLALTALLTQALTFALAALAQVAEDPDIQAGPETPVDTPPRHLHGYAGTIGVDHLVLTQGEARGAHVRKRGVQGRFLIRGMDIADRHSPEPASGMTQQYRGLFIDVVDRPREVGDDDGVRRLLDQGPMDPRAYAAMAAAEHRRRHRTTGHRPEQDAAPQRRRRTERDEQRLPAPLDTGHTRPPLSSR
ncbi:hypothetical protein KBTX_04152 [wastewater metagenome]|uniref:Uncharacterized protein n=2 Tax=unclassified sequences TaxID=12908 RepID=A0A5B8RFF8_9ZZZZ|nr:hypothetical protein KBTEX_04152 [uncultured organism]